MNEREQKSAIRRVLFDGVPPVGCSEGEFTGPYADVWRALANIRGDTVECFYCKGTGKGHAGLVELKNELDRMGILDEVGGYGFVSSLIDEVDRD